MADLPLTFIYYIREIFRNDIVYLMKHDSISYFTDYNFLSNAPRGITPAEPIREITS